MPPKEERWRGLSTQAWRRLGQVIEQFEVAWARGRVPDIDDFLATDVTRDVILRDLILTDIEWRRKKGAPLPLESYLERFPELAGDEELRNLIAGGEDLRPTSVESPRKPSEPERAITEAPVTLSVGEFVEQVHKARVLDQAQWDVLCHNQSRYHEPQSLAKQLIARGWLSAFQADALLHGQAEKLLLGNYVLVDKLGQGGMSTVWKAKHQLMKRLVAVKLIRQGQLPDAVAVERFFREIELAAQLSHPNIVIAHDAGESQGQHYLVMEYIPGENLATVIARQHPLPVPQACEFVPQTASGLEYIHRRGLVHRDIKPSNLLLSGTDAEPVVKILDLGIARLHYDAYDKSKLLLTRTGIVMGTPDYIAPEQIVDTHQVTIRADIYSLGCTLYHLLVGQPPFPGGTQQQKIASHFESMPITVQSLRPEIPAELAEVVQTMLAKNPRDRFQTPVQVVAALEPFCSVVPVQYKLVSTCIAETPTAVTPPSDPPVEKEVEDEVVAGPVSDPVAVTRTLEAHPVCALPFVDLPSTSDQGKPAPKPVDTEPKQRIFWRLLTRNPVTLVDFLVLSMIPLYFMRLAGIGVWLLAGFAIYALFRALWTVWR